MKYTTGEAIIKSLEIEGVTHAFGILGSNLLDVFDLVGRSPKMTYVGTRHEEHAAQMAHGFTRASGVMSICLVQSGSGTANLTSGFATALRMHAPILGMAGGPGNGIVDDNGRHEFNQVGLMERVTKWSARVPSAERMPEYMQRAFRIANTAPKGPVFLEVPSDVLKGEFEWEPPASKMAYRAKYEAEVSPAAIEEAANLIASAERPIFIVGQGGEDAGAWADLAAISEGSDIPLCHSFGHNTGIPHTTPLALGGIGRRGSKAALSILSESDLVVIVGSRLQRYTTIAYYGYSYWPAKARVIQVNPDPLTVGRHVKVDLGIASDAPKFLKALREQLAKKPAKRSAWRSRALAAKAEWEVERGKNAEPATFQDGKYLNPAAVYAAVGKALPDAVYLNEVGSTTAWGFCMIDYNGPRNFIYTGALAGLGFPVPGALGARLARPDSPVVAMIGDGAFSLSLQALMTAVEHKIAVRYVICDNRSWGAEKGHQLHWFDKHYVGGQYLVNKDLVDISKAIGADAVRVNTIAELQAALKVEPKDRPMVIVAPADPDDYPEPVPHAGVPARSWAKKAGKA